MEIRILTADDAGEFRRLRLEALERDAEAFGSSAEEHRALSMDEIKARLAPDPAEHFVMGAFADGQLGGTAGFFRERPVKQRHKGRIWGVYVTPGMRGAGAGRRLLQAVLERAAAIEGLEQIALSVSTTQDAAMTLYRSLGFESFGCERRSLKIGDRYFDEEYMVLRLGAGEV